MKPILSRRVLKQLVHPKEFFDQVTKTPYINETTTFTRNSAKLFVIRDAIMKNPSLADKKDID